MSLFNKQNCLYEAKNQIKREHMNGSRSTDEIIERYQINMFIDIENDDFQANKTYKFVCVTKMRHLYTKHIHIH